MCLVSTVRFVVDCPVSSTGLRITLFFLLGYFFSVTTVLSVSLIYYICECTLTSLDFLLLSIRIDRSALAIREVPEDFS